MQKPVILHNYILSMNSFFKISSIWISGRFSRISLRVSLQIPCTCFRRWFSARLRLACDHSLLVEHGFRVIFAAERRLDKVDGIGDVIGNNEIRASFAIVKLPNNPAMTFIAFKAVGFTVRIRTRFPSIWYCQELCAKRNEQLIEINRRGA